MHKLIQWPEIPWSTRIRQVIDSNSQFQEIPARFPVKSTRKYPPEKIWKRRERDPLASSVTACFSYLPGPLSCVKFGLSKMRRRLPFSSRCCEAISLSCLACHGVNSRSESFRSYSVSDSDGEGRCGATMNCWRRTPMTAPTDIANSAASSQASPRPAVTSQDPPGTPRLVRCRAVRRDIFEDWHFDDMTEDVQRPEE